MRTQDPGNKNYGRSLIKNIAQILWTIAASLCFILLLTKLLMVGAESPDAMVLAKIGGILALLYVLFLLEGLQVAGLLIKDHSEEAIRQYVTSAGYGSKEKKILNIARIFIGTFDSFVTGRQIMVIMTVVSIATLLASLTISPNFQQGTWLGLNIFREKVVGLLNTPVFSFISSTLFPAWISQLLPQFAADNRAILFVTVPGTKWVMAAASALDKAQAGYPAHWLLRVLQKFGIFNKKEVIAVGRDKFHASAIAFYGRGKESHKITIRLGARTKYREELRFVYHRGETHEIFHKVSLLAKVTGDIEISMDTPDSVETAVPKVEEIENESQYIYVVRIPLNKPLPRSLNSPDVVTLIAEYETEEDSSDESEGRWVEFVTSLPMAYGEIQIVPPRGRMICHPIISVFDSSRNTDTALLDADLTNAWTIQHETNNSIIAHISYPLIGFIYTLTYASLLKEND